MLAWLTQPDSLTFMLNLQPQDVTTWELATQRMLVYSKGLLMVIIFAPTPWPWIATLACGVRGLAAGLLVGTLAVVHSVEVIGVGYGVLLGLVLIGPQTAVMLFAYLFTCYKAVTFRNDGNFFDYVLSCLLVAVVVGMLVAYELLILANLDIFTQIG